MNHNYDDILAMKQKILYDLECAKNKMLSDLSLIDKCTLTKLRSIAVSYEAVEKRITDKINAIESKINTFIFKQAPEVVEEYDPETRHLKISVLMRGDIIQPETDFDFVYKSTTESFDIFHETGCCKCQK